MRTHRSRVGTGIIESREAPTELDGFASSEKFLEMGLHMLRSRHDLKEKLEYQSELSEERAARKEARRQAGRWRRSWHRAVSRNATALPLLKRLNGLRLNQHEREVVLVLLLRELGLLGDRFNSCQSILEELCLTPVESIKVLRQLGEGGRLRRQRVIGMDDLHESLPSRRLRLDPAFVELALASGSSLGLPVGTEEALQTYLSRLSRAMSQKVEAAQHVQKGYGNESELYLHERHANNLFRALEWTLRANRTWKLSGLFQQLDAQRSQNERERYVLLALLGKALGHLDASDDLFKGSGLTLAASGHSGENGPQWKLVSSKGLLRRIDLIRPCRGSDFYLTDAPKDLRDAEFELSPKVLDLLGIEITRKDGPVPPGMRKPAVRLEQLVLSERTTRGLEMALVQVTHGNTMFAEWGLADTFAYGRGVTLLFYGPPGTGKTGAAEAIAHELDRPLLVANYAELQNCLVGQTEKNVVAAFQDARKNDAVLFWDEADAMFFDRDSASRNWEVRDVNVLLQELERFEGVCILATNRKSSLDKALERRISLKIEFPRPDRDAREQILKLCMPKSMPLAPDVEFGRLAETDLSGGEIKNVVLNAARSAVRRGGRKARVEMADFEQAIEDLQRGSWSEDGRRPMGFRQGAA